MRRPLEIVLVGFLFSTSMSATSWEGQDPVYRAQIDTGEVRVVFSSRDSFTGSPQKFSLEFCHPKDHNTCSVQLAGNIPIEVLQTFLEQLKLQKGYLKEMEGLDQVHATLGKLFLGTFAGAISTYFSSVYMNQIGFGGSGRIKRMVIHLATALLGFTLGLKGAETLLESEDYIKIRQDVFFSSLLNQRSSETRSYAQYLQKLTPKERQKFEARAWELCQEMLLQALGQALRYNYIPVEG